MHAIATDMDRTLLPNGRQKHDGSMKLFRKLLSEKNLLLIYVTGRRIQLLKKAVAKYRTPSPNYAICDVGTRIYSVRRGTFPEDAGWRREIRKATPAWDIKKFKKSLSRVKNLHLQEKAAQNEFKLSYYLHELKKADAIAAEAGRTVRSICRAASVVYSVDETTKTGLLDVLPKHATKLAALEYLRKKLGLKKSQVIYCGDSGNDLLPLTFGYKAILVRNAIPAVRKAVVNELKRKKLLKNLYIAKGKGKLNGYYVSGILEGLISFGIEKLKTP